MLSDGTPIDALSSAQYRERYLAFKRAALERAASFVPDTVGDPEARASRAFAPDELRERATIPAGWYWSGCLARGETLRIVNRSGTPGVSALFWNAHDTSERYNAGDTVKIQWSARLTTGRLLLSDMGRVLVTIVEDTSGRHDALLGGSTRATAATAVGVAEPGSHPRNTRENFLLAVAKHGLDKRDVPPCVTFFAGVTTTDDGRFAWHDGPAPAGRHVDLLAAMDVLVVLSNAPHPLAPSGHSTGPIDVSIARAATGAHAVAELDESTLTGEARRAFENTAALVRA